VLLCFQVAALSKVVSLASCSEAGLLGTTWVIVLRTLSHLERLQAALMPGAHPTMPFGNGGWHKPACCYRGMPSVATLCAAWNACLDHLSHG
jgi:hypothetical protein